MIMSGTCHMSIEVHANTSSLAPLSCSAITAAASSGGLDPQIDELIQDRLEIISPVARAGAFLTSALIIIDECACIHAAHQQ
jgi:hypothetical protein